MVSFWNFKKHDFLLYTITMFSYACVASHQKHDIRSSNQRIKTSTPKAMQLEHTLIHWPHPCKLKAPPANIKSESKKGSKDSFSRSIVSHFRVHIRLYLLVTSLLTCRVVVVLNSYVTQL